MHYKAFQSNTSHQLADKMWTDRQTDTTENITLPHTLFEGGKEGLEFWQMSSSEKI